MLTEKDVHHVIEHEAAYMSKRLGELGTVLAVEYEWLWAVVPVNMETGEISFEKAKYHQGKESAIKRYNKHKHLLFRMVPIIQNVEIE